MRGERGAGLRGAVLYLGSYLDDAIVEERGLPTHHRAASNRQRRVACALKAAGESVIVLSSGTTMRVSWRGRLLHRALVRRAGRVPLVVAPAVGVPYLSLLMRPLLEFLCVLALTRRRRVSSLIIGNGDPGEIAVALIARLFWRVPVITALEDVSVPRVRDWLPGGDARPVQQLLIAFHQWAALRLSHMVVMPTARFVAALPRRKPYAVISGCYDVDGQRPMENHEAPASGPVRVLLAGTLTPEHGIDVFLDTVELVEASPDLRGRYVWDVCGFADGSVARRLESLNGEGSFTYHGEVPNDEYRLLLAEADLCLVLQDPSGRNAEFKTPSKAYEYLCNGKAVISTRIGDLGLLPEGVIALTDRSPRGLLEALTALGDVGRCQRQGRRARMYAAQHYDFKVVGRQLRRLLEGDTPCVR